MRWHGGTQLTIQVANVTSYSRVLSSYYFLQFLILSPNSFYPRSSTLTTWYQILSICNRVEIPCIYWSIDNALGLIKFLATQ